jgi:LemA protein
MTALWITFAVVVLIPLIYTAAIYNRLISLSNLIRNAWSNIDTELKRRYDLVPNLVETVKGYAAHEKDVLERVTEARAHAVASTGSPQNQARDENALVQALRQMFVVAEGYPELKANQHFLALQRELINTEDRIQAARRFYNGNVKDLNSLIGQVPSNVVAGCFGFKPAEFFEIDDMQMRQAVGVKL